MKRVYVCYRFASFRNEFMLSLALPLAREFPLSDCLKFSQGLTDNCAKLSPKSDGLPGKPMKDPRQYPHAALTFSESSLSEVNATYGSDDESVGSTDAPGTTTESLDGDVISDSDTDYDDMCSLVDSESDNDEFTVGPTVGHATKDSRVDDDDDDDEPAEPPPRHRRRKRGRYFKRAAGARVSTEDDDNDFDIFTTDVCDDPDARTIPESEVRAATGQTAERWKLAAEKELQESFYKMNAVSETTAEELARIGGISQVLPMKSVWSIKAGDLYKCRGVVCGNFEAKAATEQVWTAQAETSSVMAGLRLAQIRN